MLDDWKRCYIRLHPACPGSRCVFEEVILLHYVKISNYKPIDPTYFFNSGRHVGHPGRSRIQGFGMSGSMPMDANSAIGWSRFSALKSSMSGMKWQRPILDAHPGQGRPLSYNAASKVSKISGEIPNPVAYISSVCCNDFWYLSPAAVAKKPARCRRFSIIRFA